MDESSNDNFEYVFQLTKLLSTECRANRLERDKLEHLFKRLAKQSYVSYEQLSDDLSSKNKESFDLISTPSEEDRLIVQNYGLLKQIELQEYTNNKVWLLINEINEHLSSMRNFVIERKLAASKDVSNFVEEKFTMNGQRLDMSYEVLRNEVDTTREKSELVAQEFEHLINEIDWGLVPKDSKNFLKLESKLKILEHNYGISTGSLI